MIRMFVLLVAIAVSAGAAPGVAGAAPQKSAPRSSAAQAGVRRRRQPQHRLGVELEALPASAPRPPRASSNTARRTDRSRRSRI